MPQKVEFLRLLPMCTLTRRYTQISLRRRKVHFVILNPPLRKLALTLSISTLPIQFLRAQQVANNSQPTQSTTALVKKADSANSNKRNFFAHRVQFLTTDGITHFRYMDSGPGAVTARDEYYKLSSRVQFNLVGDGSTYIQARGESGRTFTASYDYTGIGMHDRYWSFNLKSLYLGQKIGEHLEAQAGGVEFDQGAGTEATYNDNDGWLEGYRLRYVGLGHRLPAKVSVTVGYVGDTKMPNVFSRLPRMGDENYIQVLAVEGLGKNRDFSAEYDSIQTVRYSREAFRWLKPHPLLPDVTVEALTRASDNPTFGWSSSLAKNIDQKGRFRPGVFYSDIPKGMFQLGGNQIFWNGDCYALGKRVGPTFKYAPTRNFDVTLFGSDRLDNTPGTRYRGQIAIHYQFAGLLNRAMS